MNVHEEEKYSFLKKENDFIAELIRLDILTIGLCLGAQLIAKAAGAKVYKAPVKEVGFSKIYLTEDGRKSSIFKKVEQDVVFFQWHDDTFDVPEQANLLGRGANCPNQIFQLGAKVYGFQGHMEITLQDALVWVDRYIQDQGQDLMIKERLVKEFEFYQESLCQLAQKTYNNILNLL